MIRLLPVAALALVACAHPQTPPAPTTCGAEKVADLVGKKRSDALSAEVKQRSGAARVRWIAPGQVVTMDYSETRLNVHTDGEGRILSFKCG